MGSTLDVLVYDGEYTENINFSSDKTITVRSKNGASTTTINGGANGRVVSFSTSNSAFARHPL